MDPALLESIEALRAITSGGSGALLLAGVVALRAIRVADRAITLIETLRNDLCPVDGGQRKTINITFGTAEDK